MLAKKVAVWACGACDRTHATRALADACCECAEKGCARRVFGGGSFCLVCAVVSELEAAKHRVVESRRAVLRSRIKLREARNIQARHDKALRDRLGGQR